MIMDAMTWSTDVFSRCNFGDVRLNKRLIKMGCQLASKMGGSLSSCFKSKNSDVVGAYRFIRNDSVSPDAIMDGVCESTAELAKDSETLLAIEDTTSLSYKHSVKKELGYLSNTDADTAAKGFFAHSAILYDPEQSRTLGIIQQRRWARKSEDYGKRQHRAKRLYTEKESYKWEEASTGIAERMGEDMKKVISVCDRDADAFEYLAYKTKENQRFVVRAAQDRSVFDESGVCISDVIVSSKKLGQFDVLVSQKAGRKERTAKVDLRACCLKIATPKGNKTVDIDSLEINVIAVTEPSPPVGQKALSWVLLTSEPIDGFEQVRKLVGYYEKRWLIEEYHKCWKSGVNVEKIRMQFSDNLERMIAILAPIALRLLQLRENLDRNKETSCLDVLTKDEFIVLWRSIEEDKKIPKKMPSLKWAYQSVARLAGWHDSKRTGRACWSKLWEGWFYLCQRLEGYLMFKAGA